MRKNVHKAIVNSFFAVLNKPPVFSGNDLRVNSADIGGNNRNTEDQCFIYGIRQSLITGKECKYMCFANERIRIIQCAQQADIL